MNRGNYIGIIFGVMAWGFGYFFSMFIPSVPQMAGLLTMFSILCINAGSILLFYTSTFEGNAYTRRRFGGENIGIGILEEQGAFWRFYQIELSKSSVTIENEVFMIDPKHIRFKGGGGVPRVAFKKGTGQSTDLGNLVPSLNTKINTAWIMEESAIARVLAVNQYQRQLFLIALVGFGIIGLISVIHLLAVGLPTKDAAEKALGACSQIISVLPSPSPTIIAKAI